MKKVDINNQKTISLSYYVGRLIYEIRKNNGLTGSELAKQVYLSQQQISRYECGKTGFQLDILLRILSALDMDSEQMSSFFSNVISKVNHKSTKNNDIFIKDNNS